MFRMRSGAYVGPKCSMSLRLFHTTFPAPVFRVYGLGFFDNFLFLGEFVENVVSLKGWQQKLLNCLKIQSRTLQMQKDRLIRRLRGLNPMQDVPDQNSAKEQRDKFQNYLASPSNLGVVLGAQLSAITDHDILHLGLLVYVLYSPSIFCTPALRNLARRI